ncbi:MAG: T9SS type A sorting domain-containing protein [bacterium]|nr:T9SS type A sorting domain-containing protein [bacterium]
MQNYRKGEKILKRFTNYKFPIILFVGMALLLLVIKLLAQAPDTLWTKTYGGTYSEISYSMAQTTGGGYIIAGTTRRPYSEDDILLIKTDSLGDTIWTRTYGGDHTDDGRSGAQTKDGGYIIAGTTTYGGQQDVWLIKTEGPEPPEDTLEITWTIQRLTYNAICDFYPSIAVDANGKAHIAYCSGTSQTTYELFYLTNKSGSWVSEQITSLPSGAKRWPSIAVDNDSSAHIALNVACSQRRALGYTTNKSGYWEGVIIDTMGGDDPNLALDAEGYAHIAFCNYPQKALCYATNKTSSWVVSKIDETGGCCFPSIAISPQGHIHIAYSKGVVGSPNTFDIWYITNESGSWVSTKVSTSDKGDMCPSLAVSANGKIYLTWKEDRSAPHYIWYATNESGSWECVDLGLEMTIHTMSPSIAVDGNNKTHFVFVRGYTTIYPEVLYGTNIKGEWKTARVTNNNFYDWGTFGSIRWFTIDNSGYGHITWWAYPDGAQENKEEIYYAKSNQPLVGVAEVSLPTASNFSIYPNPFHKSISIQFSIEGMEPVTISIYNICGRLVKTIFSSNLGAGSYTFTWNRTDNQGLYVPSGIYFCQIKGRNTSRTNKIILL